MILSLACVNLATPTGKPVLPPVVVLLQADKVGQVGIGGNASRAAQGNAERGEILATEFHHSDRLICNWATSSSTAAWFPQSGEPPGSQVRGRIANRLGDASLQEPIESLRQQGSNEG